MKNRILSVCAAALLAGLGLCAQSAPAAPAADEQKAYTALFATATNAASTAADMEKAESDFIQTFANSPNLINAEFLAVHFYQAHSDYNHELVWGEKLLQKDPNHVPTLALLAAAIPAHWKDTDLDGDQRLAEAEADANKVMQAMKDIKVDVDGAVLNGKKMTPAQVDQYKAAYTSGAYSALGHIAYDRKSYDVAVENYKKAVVDEPTQRNKCTEYFLMAVAQEKLKQWADASAALNQAAALAGTDATLKGAIEQEQANIKRLQAGSGL